MSGVRRIILEARELTGWDSGLLTFLIEFGEFGARRNIEVDRKSLPDGAGKLLLLACAAPGRTDARKAPDKPAFLSTVGMETLRLPTSSGEMLTFLGEVFRGPDLCG